MGVSFDIEIRLWLYIKTTDSISYVTSFEKLFIDSMFSEDLKYSRYSVIGQNIVLILWEFVLWIQDK